MHLLSGKEMKRRKNIVNFCKIFIIDSLKSVFLSLYSIKIKGKKIIVKERNYGTFYRKSTD